MTKQVPAATTGTQVAKRAIPRFVDFSGNSQIPDATFENTNIAVKCLGLEFSHDVFADRRYIAGHPLNTDASTQITDDGVALVRRMIRQTFGFNPGKTDTWDAINLACAAGAYHPVKRYLENLPQWDGVARIGTFFIDYMGVKDTAFVRAVSLITFIASVRRIYQPGCKYDYMVVLEGLEGLNKSTAIEMLYGTEFFSDQNILGVSDKELQESYRGRWAIEAADLSGMRKADVERVKSQLTRKADRARPAYGRAVIDILRSAMNFGTTNEEEYLRSQTGNRRFLPLKVGRIDIEAILRDRDQLWAEAMAEEQWAESIMLPEELWIEAGVEQAKRTLGDPWRDELVDFGKDKAAKKIAETAGHYEVFTLDNEERIASSYLIKSVLGLSLATTTPEHSKRLGLVMRKLGWEGPEGIQICGRVQRGYFRKVTQ